MMQPGCAAFSFLTPVKTEMPPLERILVRFLIRNDVFAGRSWAVKREGRRRGKSVVVNLYGV